MNLKIEASLQTGDLVLFRGTGWISWLVEWFGVSKYSHVGIIITNPRFLDPDLEDGTYLLESAWTPSKDHHAGVQLHLLDDVIVEYPKGAVVIRKVDHTRDAAFYQTLTELYKEIRNKPYDMNPWDWLCAKYNMICPLPPDPAYQTTKRFWCSALVSYLFCHLGIIEKDINWSLIAPREFSSEARWIRFLCPIEKEVLLV